MVIRKKYDDRVREKSGNKAESLTQQQFKKESDINEIMNRVKKGLPIDPMLVKQNGTYMNTINVPNLMEAHNILEDAKDSFYSIPSDVREKFNNDPVEFLKFIGDNKNKEKAIELGLIEKPAPNYQKNILEELEKLNKNGKPDSNLT